MVGLAARPGTDVLPKWERRLMRERGTTDSSISFSLR